MALIRATARELSHCFNFVASPSDLRISGGIERITLLCDRDSLSGAVVPQDPRLAISGEWKYYNRNEIGYNFTINPGFNPGVPASFVPAAIGATDAGRTLTISWMGTALSLSVFSTVGSGKLTVSTDASVPTVYDLYNASGVSTYTTPLFIASGLDYGHHSTVVTVLGTKDPSALGSSVIIYGVDIFSTTETALRYATGTAYSAGAQTTVNTAGTLPALAIIGSAPYRRDLVVLDKGATVPRVVTGTAGSASDTLAQFQLKNRVAFRIEAEDTSGKLANIWATATTPVTLVGNDTLVSIGNSTTFSDTSSADYLMVGFIGTGIDMLAPTWSDRGQWYWSVDGGAETLADSYSAIPYTKRFNLAYNLTYGYHQLKIRKAGTKNASATGYYVTLDAFDVYHPIAPATPADSIALAEVDVTPSDGWIRYDDAAGWVYTGANWGAAGAGAGADFTGGTRRPNSNTNTTDAATFTFVGVQYRLLMAKHNSRGIVALYLDGVFVQNLNLYDAAGLTNVSVVAYTSPALAAGVHTVEIRMTNSKDDASVSTAINLDAIDVLPLPVQVRDVRKLAPVDTQTEANRAVVGHVSATHNCNTPVTTTSTSTTTASTTMVTLTAFNTNAMARSGWVDVDFTGVVSATSTSAIVSLAVINTTTGETGPTLDFAVPAVATGRAYSVEVRRAFQVPAGYTHTFSVLAKTSTGTATIAGLLNVEAKGF